MVENIELGDEVKDKVTGFKGIAVAKCIYLHGCIQFQVQPKAADNKLVKGHWIDEPQLELTTAAAKKKRLDDQIANYGGIRPHPDS